ncbi:COMM domain containing protein 7 [Dissostichus eleginoides]|uniref:COMM domain containing protein 7 n=1 Tax=Dissostichus eleginoides TaxID=100907 RepID=A0AAD9CDJ6_DISEL|nr:COMM domain containing protein 7 [Dissostichus eleginoides]
MRTEEPGSGVQNRAALTVLRVFSDKKMQLNFTKDVLPDSVSTDFQNLNKLNEQQFLRLIEILFQFLLEPKEFGC